MKIILFEKNIKLGISFLFINNSINAVYINDKKNIEDFFHTEYLYVVGYKKFALLIMQQSKYRKDLIEYQRYYFHGKIKDDVVKTLDTNYIREKYRIIFFRPNFQCDEWFMLHYNYDHLTPSSRHDFYDNIEEEKIPFSTENINEYDLELKKQIYKELINRFEKSVLHKINYVLPRILKKK